MSEEKRKSKDERWVIKLSYAQLDQLRRGELQVVDFGLGSKVYAVTGLIQFGNYNRAFKDMGVECYLWEFIQDSAVYVVKYPEWHPERFKPEIEHGDDLLFNMRFGFPSFNPPYNIKP